MEKPVNCVNAGCFSINHWAPFACSGRVCCIVLFLFLPFFFVAKFRADVLELVSLFLALRQSFFFFLRYVVSWNFFLLQNVHTVRRGGAVNKGEPTSGIA